MIWIGRDDIDWYISQFFNMFDIVQCCLWQVVMIFYVEGGFRLVWYGFVNWFYIFLVVSCQWSGSYFVIIWYMVSYVEFNFFQVIQNVQFSQVEVRQGVQLYCMMNGNGVQLVGMMMMFCSCVEFVILFVEEFVSFIKQFGWEWICIYMSGVSFEDIQNVINIMWVQVGIGCYVISSGVGRSYVWISIVVDIQQCILCIFKYDEIVMLMCLVEQVRNVNYYRSQDVGNSYCIIQNFLVINCFSFVVVN